MTDIIAEAIRAACVANEEGRCRWKDPAECGVGCREPVIVIAAFKSAYPRDPSAERLAVVERAMIDKIGVPDAALARSLALVAYHTLVDPLYATSPSEPETA